MKNKKKKRRASHAQHPTASLVSSFSSEKRKAAPARNPSPLGFMLYLGRLIEAGRSGRGPRLIGGARSRHCASAAAAAAVLDCNQELALLGALAPNPHDNRPTVRYLMADSLLFAKKGEEKRVEGGRGAFSGAVAAECQGSDCFGGVVYLELRAGESGEEGFLIDYLGYLLPLPPRP